MVTPLTRHEFEVERVVRVDEATGWLHYMARDGDNPMKLQLHRVSFDGTGEMRLTDPAFHHSIQFAPDGKHFIDVAQTHNAPPVTRLMTAEGQTVAELAKSDLTRFKKLGMKPVELLTFKAADGVTDLYGMLHFPSDFSPRKKYPLLVSVYGGPETVGARETFSLPDRLTEYGFLVATFDSRTASGRGKKFLDAIYEKLGEFGLQAVAAALLELREEIRRPLGAIFVRVVIHRARLRPVVARECVGEFPQMPLHRFRVKKIQHVPRAAGSGALHFLAGRLLRNRIHSPLALGRGPSGCVHFDDFPILGKRDHRLLRIAHELRARRHIERPHDRDRVRDGILAEG